MREFDVFVVTCDTVKEADGVLNKSGCPYYLKAGKPNDRSDQDRYCAITITEVEKAKAVFAVYCKPEE